MTSTLPIPQIAAEMAAFAWDSLVSFLQAATGATHHLTQDSPDGWIDMVMSGLAGVAAALTMAILVTVYFRTGYRSARDIVRHGLAAAGLLGLAAFVAYDLSQAALAYLGINA
jgi:hypothetical protein